MERYMPALPVCPGLFEGYKVYGPYGKRRKIVALVSADHQTTMAYARYLMSVKLGRELTSNEEVDHIDDDCTNDHLDNLQILTPSQNRAKQNERRRKNAMVSLVCPECGDEFTRMRRNTTLRSKGSGGPSCCSRSCAARYHNKRRVRAA